VGFATALTVFLRRVGPPPPPPSPAGGPGRRPSGRKIRAGHELYYLFGQRMDEAARGPPSAQPPGVPDVEGGLGRSLAAARRSIQNPVCRHPAVLDSVPTSPPGMPPGPRAWPHPVRNPPPGAGGGREGGDGRGGGEGTGAPAAEAKVFALEQENSLLKGELHAFQAKSTASFDKLQSQIHLLERKVG